MKIVDILITIIGIVLILPLLTIDIGVASSWIIAIAVLVIGVGKLTKKL